MLVFLPAVFPLADSSHELKILFAHRWVSTLALRQLYS